MRLKSSGPASSLILCLLCLLLLVRPGWSSPVPTPRIAVHIVAVSGKANNLCNNPPTPPCNDGEANFTVHGGLPTVPTRYLIYILATDGWSTINGVTYGIAGANFGISYDEADLSGVDVRTWAFCGDLAFPSGSPNPVWPDSGSGVSVTWSPQTNCQSTPTTGDLDGGVTVVLAVLDVDVYSDDVFSITPREYVQNPDLAITDCEPREITIQYPEGAGKASFGSQDLGYDPCRGRYVPFSEFESLPSEELSTVTVKLTPMFGPVQSLILRAPGSTADSTLFEAYHRVGFAYVSDVPLSETPEHDLDLTTVAMGAVLDSIAATPEATDGNVDSPPALSVSIFETYGAAPKGYEAILNKVGGATLLGRLRGAVGDPTLAGELDGFACALGMLSQNGPTDVTSLVSVNIGGFRMDHATGEFVGQVSVQNISAQSIAAPVSLILNEGQQVNIANATGLTCRAAPGPTYFDLNVGTTFDPNATAEITVRIRGVPPKLAFNPVVYSGEGSR